jgi:glutamate dehydrogenase
MKQDQSAFSQQTLCWEKKSGRLVQRWLSGHEMHNLYSNNIHETPCDCFITAGGRPRTLNESNAALYFDEAGKMKTRAIVEGANLYLTPNARQMLEKRGVLIMKDSSCNKGGVICSSFEVLSGLCLAKEEFLEIKEKYVREVREIIGQMALSEARLILSTHQTTQEPMSAISDQLSEKINLFKYQLLETIELPEDRGHFLNRCLLAYAPPLLGTRYPDRLFAIPEIHKKAIIASFLAAHLVYSRGVSWSPALADILPALSQEMLHAL